MQRHNNIIITNIKTNLKTGDAEDISCCTREVMVSHTIQTKEHGGQ